MTAATPHINANLTRGVALRRFDDQALSIVHGAVCYSECGWEIDQTLVDELCRVRHEWVWLNRERKGRPGRDDRAWAEHQRLQVYATRAAAFAEVFNCIERYTTQNGAPRRQPTQHRYGSGSVMPAATERLATPGDSSRRGGVPTRP